MTPPPHSQSSSQRAHTRRWIPALLLAAFAAQSLWFIATQSLTYDEPAHIIAGVEAWQQGKFEHWNDHPPLGRLWLTLPLASAHTSFAWQQLSTGFAVTQMQPSPERIAWRTRPMNTLLGIALGLAIWFAARRLFSDGAANVALALFAFAPSLVAHFSVATTDGIGALFIFLTAFQLVRWRHDPTRAQTVLTGLALGGLLLTKFYAPPLVAVALVLMLIVGRDRLIAPWRDWNWKPALMALGIAAVILWAGYFFHVSHLRIGDGQVIASFPNRPVKTWATHTKARLTAIVPAGEFLEGLREVALSNRRGRAAWFLGHIYPKGGIKLYYPIAIALKWPTILLVFTLGGLLLALRRGNPARGDLLLMCVFAVVFLLFALNSRYDIGERHILPLYPFALLLAAGVWQSLRGYRNAVVILILLLCLNAADALRYAPDYLAYFNFFIPRAERWRLLTDSNLDWGQGLIALRKYEQQLPRNQPLHLAYFGSVDPVLYGVRAAPLLPNEVAAGRIAIGATLMSGQTLDDPDEYQWLLTSPSVGTIDSSMWIFDVRENRDSPLQ